MRCILQIRILDEEALGSDLGRRNLVNVLDLYEMLQFENVADIAGGGTTVNSLAALFQANCNSIVSIDFWEPDETST